MACEAAPGRERIPVAAKKTILTSAYKVNRSSQLRGALCQGLSCWAREGGRHSPVLPVRKLGLASINGSNFLSTYGVSGPLPGALYRLTFERAAQSYEVSSHFYPPSMFEDTKI